MGANLSGFALEVVRMKLGHTSHVACRLERNHVSMAVEAACSDCGLSWRKISIALIDYEPNLHRWPHILGGCNYGHDCFAWVAFLSFVQRSPLQFWLTIALHTIACVGPFWMLVDWSFKLDKARLAALFGYSSCHGLSSGMRSRNGSRGTGLLKTSR